MGRHWRHKLRHRRWHAACIGTRVIVVTNCGSNGHLLASLVDFHSFLDVVFADGAHISSAFQPRYWLNVSDSFIR